MMPASPGVEFASVGRRGRRMDARPVAGTVLAAMDALVLFAVVVQGLVTGAVARRSGNRRISGGRAPSRT